MSNKQKEKVIQNAIQEYRNSVTFGFSTSTPRAINGMEQAFIMCAPFNIRGTDVLKKTIKEAKEKYKKELSE